MNTRRIATILLAILAAASLTLPVSAQERRHTRLIPISGDIQNIFNPTPDYDGVLQPSVLARTGYIITRHIVSQRFGFYVVDDTTGQLVPNWPVTIVVSADYQSGGHTHFADTTPRPHGWVSADFSWAPPDNGPTGSLDDNGIVVNTGPQGQAAEFVYIAPEMAGTEQITGSAPDCTSAQFNLVIQMGVYLPLPPASTYSLVGGPPAFPHDNHYGTPDLLQAITALSINYFTARQQSMPVNDMSLIWGGLFDIGPVDGYTYWFVPHGGHRRGINIDISIPVPDTRFVSMVRDQGWWEQPYQEAGHYHLTLSGKGKVTIRAASHPSSEAWQNRTQRLLQVGFTWSNQGGLDADVVTLTSLAASNGVTLPPGQGPPVSLGSLAIGQSVTQTFLFQIPSGVKSFDFTAAGNATSGGRTFAFRSTVHVSVPR